MSDHYSHPVSVRLELGRLFVVRRVPQYWSMITALSSLTDLSFHTCLIVDPPFAGVEPKKSKEFMLKLSRLSVANYDDTYLEPIKAVDMECLHIFTMNLWALDGVSSYQGDWLLKSAVTELHFHVNQHETLCMDFWLNCTLTGPHVNPTVSRGAVFPG